MSKNKKLNIIDDNLISNVLDELEVMHPEASCALGHDNNFELLIAVVLSAQTTDARVNMVTPDLFSKYPDAASLAAADIDDVKEIIRIIGFFNTKSANIIKLSQQLLDRFGGEVPGDFDDLVSLPGVGRKTANVVLSEAFGENRIAVDTHVFRVANRIGLTDAPTPEYTEEMLMERLPENMWTRAHHLLIFHGRKCCDARKPKCDGCRISDICIYKREHMKGA